MACAPTLWYRPGITNRIETQIFDANGTWLATRFGDAEVRPAYDDDGLERGQRTFARSAANRQIDVLVREEDEYKFDAGGRESRIQTYLEAKPHDVFRAATDSEGRLTVDQIRRWPGRDLRTVLHYDGASDRVVDAEQRQNGLVRTRYVVQPLNRQADGSYHVPVRVIPNWGLSATQTFVLGETLARPIRIEYENGDRAEGKEWYQGTVVPRITEVRDRRGLPKERHERPVDENIRVNAVASSLWDTAKFGSNGEKLFEFESVYDASGRNVSVRTARTGHSGSPALKISYLIPEPDVTEWSVVARESDGGIPLTRQGTENSSDSDFLYFFVQSPAHQTARFVVGDASGKSVSVGGSVGRRSALVGQQGERPVASRPHFSRTRRGGGAGIGISR